MRTSNPGGLPIGGLTVVAFPNNHLVYAITWFGLALMLCAWAIFAAIEERRRAFRQKDARAWLERLVDFKYDPAARNSVPRLVRRRIGRAGRRRAARPQLALGGGKTVRYPKRPTARTSCS